ARAPDELANGPGVQRDGNESELAEPSGTGGGGGVGGGVAAWSPVFAVTPAALIDAMVTEKGVVERPDAEAMRAMFGPCARARPDRAGAVRAAWRRTPPAARGGRPGGGPG